MVQSRRAFRAKLVLKISSPFPACITETCITEAYQLQAFFMHRIGRPRGHFFIEKSLYFTSVLLSVHEDVQLGMSA